MSLIFIQVYFSQFVKCNCIINLFFRQNCGHSVTVFMFAIRYVLHVGFVTATSGIK